MIIGSRPCERRNRARRRPQTACSLRRNTDAAPPACAFACAWSMPLDPRVGHAELERIPLGLAADEVIRTATVRERRLAKSKRFRSSNPPLAHARGADQLAV